MMTLTTTEARVRERASLDFTAQWDKKPWRQAQERSKKQERRRASGEGICLVLKLDYTP